MKRIYHPYNLWEDFQNGMYAVGEFDDKKLSLAQQLLGNSDDLRSSMDAVIQHWVFAAEVNLSNRGRNRQAWLGQAACSYTHDVPEEATRIAWGLLTDDERIKANLVADEIISKWENFHNQKLNA